MRVNQFVGDNAVELGNILCGHRRHALTIKFDDFSAFPDIFVVPSIGFDQPQPSRDPTQPSKRGDPELLRLPQVMLRSSRLDDPQAVLDAGIGGESARYTGWQR